MKILALLGAIQGMILLLYVLPSKKNRVANRYFIIGISLCIAQIFLVSYVQNPIDPSGTLFYKLLSWVFPSIIAVFPYFYFRFLLSENQKLTRADALYFVPFILNVLAILPHMWLIPYGPDAWVHIAPYGFAMQGLMHTLFGSIIIMYFALKIFQLHEDYRFQVLNHYSDFKPQRLYWIRGNAIGILVIGITGFAGAIVGVVKISDWPMSILHLWSPDYLVFIIVSLMFYWQSYKVIQSPELFRLVEGIDEKKEKYAHSRLEPERARQLSFRLIDLMQAEKLYLNPHLQLTDLALRLGVSNQILSQLINQQFNQNFYDFINGYRIQEAKQKLSDPGQSHLTILGIAQESGFKSKSTFYELFKKSTGLTPRQFQLK